MNIKLIDDITAGVSETGELLKEAETAATEAERSLALLVDDKGELDSEAREALYADSIKKAEIARAAIDRVKTLRATTNRNISKLLIDAAGLFSSQADSLDSQS